MHTEKQNFFWEILKFTAIALLVVMPIRMYVASPFLVSGASMHPTFETGDYLIVDRLSYNFESPQRGDVIVFKYPNDPSRYFIKRIIGLPNETLELKANKITIYNQENPNGFLLKEPYIDEVTPGSLKKEIPEGKYFVMGDNRVASSDSRSWGLLDEKYIAGYAILRLLPVNLIGAYPGEYKF